MKLSELIEIAELKHAHPEEIDIYMEVNGNDALPTRQAVFSFDPCSNEIAITLTNRKDMP